MNTSTTLIKIAPVIPSADITRDVAWHQEKTGFETIFSDKRYAVLRRDQLELHLQ